VEGRGWAARWLAAAVIAVVLLAPVSAAWGTERAGRAAVVRTPDEAITSAVRWLARQQYPDGGFDGFGAATATPEAVLAFAESAQTESTWANRAAVERVEQVLSEDDRSPLDAARSLARGNQDPALAGRLVSRVALPLGLDVAEQGPFGSVLDLATEGVVDEQVAFADRVDMAIALVSAGVALPEGVLDTVLGAQQDTGGWSADGDPAAETMDLPTTGAVVDLLILVGNEPASPPVAAALLAIAGAQARNGAWPAQGDGSSVLATAGAIRAIRAVGQDPADTCWQTDRGRPATSETAAAALLAMQDADGHFGAADSVLETAAAVHALSGRWLPRGRGTASCGPSEGRDFPVDPALVVLGAIAVVGVGGGVRILRSAPSAY
jgi:hypothetical protein